MGTVINKCTLSSRRAVVLGAAHSTSLSLQIRSNNCWNSDKNTITHVIWLHNSKFHSYNELKYCNKRWHIIFGTWCLVIGSRWEFHSENLLQFFSHVNPLEWWSAVNLPNGSFRPIGMILHLITTSDTLHHTYRKIYSIIMTVFTFVRSIQKMHFRYILYNWHTGEHIFCDNYQIIIVCISHIKFTRSKFWIMCHINRLVPELSSNFINTIKPPNS